MMKEFVKSTIVGGFLFMLPLALFVYLFGYAVQLLAAHVVQPVAAQLHIGGWVATPLVAIVLILACFFAGMVARTHAAKRVIDWFEESSLGAIPQYQQLKRVSKRLGGGDDMSRCKPCLVRASGGWQLGLRLEEIGDGLVAVYVPNVPDAATGRLVYVMDEQLRDLDLTIAQAMEIVQGYGIGSAGAWRVAKSRGDV